MRHPILLPALALVAVLAACGDHEQLTSPDRRVPAPNASISDGAHSLGNRNFFFLPPVVRNPVNEPGFSANEFNGGLQARVVICVLGAPSASDGSRQCVADFRTFTSDQIAVSTTDKLYQVNWDTKSPAIDVNSYYRIQVFVGSTRLGYADVDPVSNGSGLKNVDTDEYIGLVDGRTLPIKFTIHRQALCQSTDCAEVYLNDDGGVVRTNTGFAAARFPDGWLPDAFKNQQVLVTIDRVPFTTSAQCHPLTTGLTQFEGCYTFRTDPYVGTFSLPVTAQVCTTVDVGTPLYHSLQLFSSGPNEPVHALPDAAAPDIFCEGFGPTPVQIGAAAPAGALGYAMKGLKAIGRGFDALFSVKSAYAIHLGLGGETFAFSNIGWGSMNDLVVGSTDFDGTVGTTHTITARVVKNHSDIELLPDGEGDPTDAPIPVAGVNVIFSAGETVLATVPTDANGYATYDWTLGSAPGTEMLTISSPDASGGGTVTATVWAEYYGEATDGTGDGAGAESNVAASDLTFASVRAVNGNLEVVIRFAPGTRSDTTMASMSLDTDQSSATGHPGVASSGTIDNDQIGVEYLLQAGAPFNGGQARLMKYAGTLNSFTFVGSFPATITGDEIHVTLPLSAIQDEGGLNFKVTSSVQIGTNAFTGILDVMTNVGLPAASTFNLSIPPIG
jgi:hypothetical protein